MLDIWILFSGGAMNHSIIKRVIAEQLEIIQNAVIIDRDYAFEKISIISWSG